MYIMEVKSSQFTGISEIFGLIDHKIRGIQQILLGIIELNESREFSKSLKELIIKTEEIQKIYSEFLKVRALKEEKFNLKDILKNSNQKCNKILNTDREKLKYVIETIRNYSSEPCKIYCLKNDKQFSINFESDDFKKINGDYLSEESVSIENLSLFASKKIAERINGKLVIKEKTISIILSD